MSRHLDSHNYNSVIITLRLVSLKLRLHLSLGNLLHSSLNNHRHSNISHLSNGISLNMLHRSWVGGHLQLKATHRQVDRLNSQ